MTVTSTDLVLYKGSAARRDRRGYQWSKLKFSVTKTWHNLRVRDDREKIKDIVVLIPACNEAASIARTISHVRLQTRTPDRIVVIANNCTDNTAEVARATGVTVLEMENNQHKKTGALNAGWKRYAQDAHYVIGMDADTALDSQCIEQLERELEDTPSAGGIMARYTFDREHDSALVALQRIEFANWQADLMAKRRTTYVLGGQCSLFRGSALKKLAELLHGLPWDTSTDVEDMKLTGDMRKHGHQTLVSATARAYADPMHSVRKLWHQRRKWDEGMVRLLTSQGLSKWTMALWRQQISLLNNGVTRLLFAIMLTAALTAGKFRWEWWWAIPPALAVLLNFRNVMRVPNRRAEDVLLAVTLVPIELYLIFRTFCAAASWFTVLSGQRRDGWAQQYNAEAGGAVKALGPLKILLGVTAIVGVVYGAVYAWQRWCPGALQDWSLTLGWEVLGIITAVQCLFMLYRIVRPSHGLKP